MPNEDVVLAEAPDRFLGAEAWKSFVAYLRGSRSEALKALSYPTIPYIDELRTASQQNPFAFRELDLIERARAHLLREFQGKMLSGQLICSGFSHLTIDREQIPKERWTSLAPNFFENKVHGNGLIFTDVRISDSASPVPPNRLDECRIWLRQRKEEGESRKKILAAEALALFGSDLTVRVFSAAYKDVFDKPRGRPRKSLK